MLVSAIEQLDKALRDIVRCGNESSRSESDAAWIRARVTAIRTAAEPLLNLAACATADALSEVTNRVDAGKDAVSQLVNSGDIRFESPANERKDDDGRNPNTGTANTGSAGRPPQQQGGKHGRR